MGNVTQYKNLINGWLVETCKWMDVVNPSNEEVIGQVPACSAGDLDRAVEAARAAFKTWKTTPIETRRAALQAMAKIIQDNHDEPSRLLTSQQGKPPEQAHGENMGTASITAGRKRRAGGEGGVRT